MQWCAAHTITTQGTPHRDTRSTLHQHSSATRQSASLHCSHHHYHAVAEKQHTSAHCAATQALTCSMAAHGMSMAGCTWPFICFYMLSCTPMLLQRNTSADIFTHFSLCVPIREICSPLILPSSDTSPMMVHHIFTHQECC